jgi:hypothetical protein
MKRIQFEKLRNVTTTVGAHLVAFDKDGIAEVDNETAISVSGIPGFTILPSLPSPSVVVEEAPTPDEVEPLLIASPEEVAALDELIVKEDMDSPEVPSEELSPPAEPRRQPTVDLSEKKRGGYRKKGSGLQQ